MWIKTGLAVAALAVLSGCAGQTTQKKTAPTVPEVEYTFNDPSETPREQWSTAMLVAHDLMGIGGLKDVVAPEPVTDSSSGVGSWNGADSLATGALGAISPTTHVSAGGSLAIGAGLSLLSGRIPAPLHTPQVAFFVPADMASNAEEASQIAAKTWVATRKKITGRNEKVELVKTGAWPSNHSKNYATLKDTYWNNPTPFEGEARRIDVAGLTGEFYGPIFIDRAGRNVANDAWRGKLEPLELIERYAEELPYWATMYLQPTRDKGKAAPMTVIFKNKTHHFIAPNYDH